MTRTAPRVGVRLIKAVAALAALLAVIVGVPALLIAIGAVPHGLPSVHAAVDSLTRKDDTGAYFRTAGAAVVWIAWAVFTAVTVKEVAASIRLVRIPDVYKGKGVRYKGEVVRKLPGKTVAATGTGGK